MKIPPSGDVFLTILVFEGAAILEDKTIKIVNNGNLMKSLEEIGLDKNTLRNLLKTTALEITSIKKKFNDQKSNLYLEFPDKKMGFSLVSDSLVVACFGIGYYHPTSWKFQIGVEICLFTKMGNGLWMKPDYSEHTMKPETVALSCAKIRSLVKRNSTRIDPKRFLQGKGWPNLNNLGFDYLSISF